jgi:hypothetical protein
VALFQLLFENSANPSPGVKQSVPSPAVLLISCAFCKLLVALPHLCLSFGESEHLVLSSLPFAMIACQRQQQDNQLWTPWSPSFIGMKSSVEPPRHNLLSLSLGSSDPRLVMETFFCIYMRHFSCIPEGK